MEDTTGKDRLHIDMLANEMEQSLSTALEASVAKIINMPLPMLSMLYGDLNRNVLWKLMSLVYKSHKTEDSVTLLCLLTDYISSECSAIGMSDMATEMSARRGNDPTNFIKQLAILWNITLIKAKTGLEASPFNGLVKNLERYSQAFSSHGLDRFFNKSLEMAKALNKMKLGDSDIDPSDFNLDIDINLPSSSCIPYKTMLKMSYADTNKYCPLYDKAFRGMSTKQIKKEVRMIKLDDKLQFPAVNIEGNGNELGPGSKNIQESSDTKMKQASGNSSNNIVNCDPELTRKMMERSDNKQVKVGKNKTKEISYMYQGSCHLQTDRENQKRKTAFAKMEEKESMSEYCNDQSCKMMYVSEDTLRRKKNAFQAQSVKENVHVHGHRNMFACSKPCMTETKQDAKMSELHRGSLKEPSSKLLKTHKENKDQDKYLVGSTKPNMTQRNGSLMSKNIKQNDFFTDKGHKHIYVAEQEVSISASSVGSFPKFSKNIDKKLQTLSEEMCKKNNENGDQIQKLDASVDKTNFDLHKKLDKLEYAICNLMETIDEDCGLKSQNLQGKNRDTCKLVEKDVNICHLQTGKYEGGKPVLSASSSLTNMYQENSAMTAGIMTERRDCKNSVELKLDGNVNKKKISKEKDIRCYFSTPSPNAKKRKITPGEDNCSPAKSSRYHLPFSSRF